jgi:divalent metal cation (Fe/Co/Zn/Cd) transporter
LPPDDDHPLGHGRELYLWSFVVAVLMFTFGAGVTVLEGARNIFHPTDLADARISYIVLSVSFVFEAVTWVIAVREFGRTKGQLSYVQAIRASKDPPNFLVILEDSAALLGILIAAAATFAVERFHLPQLDGWGSVGIAVVLAIVALISARESKGLLLGEPARPRVRKSILAIAQNAAGVERADLVFTVHLGPQQVLVALSVEFADALATSDIEKTIWEIENEIQHRNQEVIAVFVKPQTVTRFRNYRDRIRAQIAAPPD